LKAAIEEFGIKYLIHFTQAKNLENIFRHGLLSVDELVKKEISYEYNDAHRFDNCKDAICLSIQFPNYRMFYKYRDQNRDIDWVVLGLKKSVLWKKPCAFCTENAASSNISATKVQERMGVNTLRQLYDEYPNKPSRKSLGIANAFPTNPQAEVLVFDKIEVDYIRGVAFESPFTKKKYNHLIPSNVKAKVISRFYKYRCDYEYWR
jgi:hypothetical protein